MFGRLQDQSLAGLWRAITTASNRAGRARRFVGDEVALSLRWTPDQGSREVETAWAACALPGLVEALEDGTFTSQHVRRVLRDLDAVPAWRSSSARPWCSSRWPPMPGRTRRGWGSRSGA